MKKNKVEKDASSVILYINFMKYLYIKILVCVCNLLCTLKVFEVC